MQLTSNLNRAYIFANLSSYSLKDRLLIRGADLVFFLLIKLIGRTIKFEIEGWDNWEAASRDGKIPIYTFWHNRVFLATYFWRRRRIVVMTSRSFDGERSEEHTSELQSRLHLVCRLLLEKKKPNITRNSTVVSTYI